MSSEITTISVAISTNQVDQLDVMAKRLGVNRSEMFRRLVGAAYVRPSIVEFDDDKIFAPEAAKE